MQGFKKNKTNEMKANEEHIDFFNKLESPFEKSEDQLWDEIAKCTEEKPEIKPKTLYFKWFNYSVAAVVLLLVGITFFMKLYTKTISQHKADQLRLLKGF